MTPEQAAKNLDDLRRNAPTLVGNEIVNFALDNWDNQGFKDSGITPWESRKDKRQTQAILVGKQSGRLRRSIRITRKSGSAVQAGSDLEYAAIHNTGGRITVSVTPKSRKFFWAMHYATGLEHWKYMALTKKKTLQIHIPKRQYIGNSVELDRRIKVVIEHALKRALT